MVVRGQRTIPPIFIGGGMLPLSARRRTDLGEQFNSLAKPSVVSIKASEGRFFSLGRMLFMRSSLSM